MPFDSSYENWISNFCTSLINSHFLDDEIFFICEEMFIKKVSFINFKYF